MQVVYRQAAAAILRAHGIAQPHVQLTQVLRVDLDGDGAPEVLVTATYYQDGIAPHAAAGNYSLVKEDSNPAPTMVLPPGNYIVHVGFGLATAVKPVVLRGPTVREDLGKTAQGYAPTIAQRG